MNRKHEVLEDEYARIVRAHYAGLIDFAFSLLRSEQDAQDVVHEVLLRMWERREELLPQVSVRGYLFRSVRNRSLNRLRDAKRTVRLSAADEPEPTGPSDRIDFRDLIRDYHRAVAELPERQREAFRLSRLYGLTYSEIGDVMGTSVHTVRSQIAAALRHLRERLAHHL